jgi:hypothetical protein
MNVRQYLTRRVTHPWALLCSGIALAVCGIVLIQQLLPKVGHDVSAANYASMKFDGLISSNGFEYGSFSITNRHRHPLQFHVNNVQVLTHEGWKYYASWVLGASTTNSILGSLHNRVAPSQTETFLVRSPGQGDAWRIHVGVLRGVQGPSLKMRARILFRTLSIPAALTRNPAVTTGYYQFTFAGMLDSQDIRSHGRNAPRIDESKPQ